MENLLAETIRLLEEGQDLAWATVIQNTGSTPRRAGSRMLVDRAGSVVTGSVGGGRLEADTLDLVRRILPRRGRELLRFDLTGRDAAETDMICGGRAAVFVETLTPGDLETVRCLADFLAQGRRPLWLTWISPVPDDFQGSHLLLWEGRARAGRLPLQAEFYRDLSPRGDQPLLATLPDDLGLLFCEMLGPKSRLYIFGGGHVALELAWLASRLDFEVVVVDDREDFANRERFPMASEVWVRPLDRALEGVRMDDHCYLVIVTRGHMYDLEVLHQCLAGRPAYLGMIGSRRKRNLIYKELLSRGVDPVRLEEVHSPIGIKMPAETPAEIALSIAVELVTTRAEESGRAGAKKGRGGGHTCREAATPRPLALEPGKGAVR